MTTICSMLAWALNVCCTKTASVVLVRCCAIASGGMAFLFRTASVNQQFDKANQQFEKAKSERELLSLKADLGSLERELGSLERKLILLYVQPSSQQGVGMGEKEKIEKKITEVQEKITKIKNVINAINAKMNTSSEEGYGALA